MPHYQTIWLQTFGRFFVGIIKCYPQPVEKPDPISGGMSNQTRRVFYFLLSATIPTTTRVSISSATGSTVIIAGTTKVPTIGKVISSSIFISFRVI